MISISRISQCLILVVLIPIAVFGNPAAWQQSSPESAKLHIVAIGISKYEFYKASEVPAFAAKDARDFVASMESVARAGFDSVTTRVFLDEQATRAAIGSAIDELRATVKPQDTLVFFYSGHGMTRTLGKNKEEQFYLIPYNFNPGLGNSELSNKGIASVLLQSWLLSIRAQHQFIVLNSSKSGHGFEGFISRAEEDNKFLGPKDRRDLAVLFNNTGSYELKSLENGLLPYVLIEALKENAVTADRVVTAKELIDYVEQNARAVLHKSANTATRRLLSRLTNFGLPSSYLSGEDFPVGAKPAGTQANLSQEKSRKRSAFTQLRAHSSLRTVSQPLAIKPEVPISKDDDPVFILPAECAALSEVREARGTSRKGKDHALLFGTDLYDNWTPLINPTLDASAIAETLNTRFGFETEVVKNASKGCVSQFLAKYGFKKYGDDEQLLIFFAGHGSYKSNYDGFLIARDSAASNLDPGGDSWIAHALLARKIDSIPCKHIFLVLDSCFGGAMATALTAPTSPVTGSSGSGTDSAGTEPEIELLVVLLQFRTRRFLTSGGTEYVSDGLPGRHSPFANKFLSSFETNPQNSTFYTVSEIIPRVKFANPYQPIILYDSWPSNDSRSEFFFFIAPPS